MKDYILGNTIDASLSEINENHMIPVFTKDNTALISASTFISEMGSLIDAQGFKEVSHPIIKLSHPIKGRIPEARHKKKEDLLDSDKTIYYERTIFLYRINSIKRMVNGNELSLIFGGVKAYNLDNFNKDCSALQSFKIFAGFQVQVCSNLCIWTDGAVNEVKVNSIEGLHYEMAKMIQSFDVEKNIDSFSHLHEYTLHENDFAKFIGRCKMYLHLSNERKLDLQAYDLTDSMINNLVRHFFLDDHFRMSNMQIDLWSLYNLMTASTKSSYIDKFVTRTLNSAQIIQELQLHMDGYRDSYFLT